MGRQISRADKSLTTNLPQLQNLIKRDPGSYTNEFLQQLRFLDAQLHLLLSASSTVPTLKELPELLSFISHTVPHYMKTHESARLVPNQLAELLKTSGQNLLPEIRKALVSALIRLRNRNAIDSLSILPLFFHLLRFSDKQLRESVHTFIVQDIKSANAKHLNNKLNKSTQNLLYAILTPPIGYTPPRTGAKGLGQANTHPESHDSITGWSPIAAQKSLQICIELYKRRIWMDAKTVNVIADACFSPVSKIMSTAVHFFLNADQVGDPDDDPYGDEGRKPSVDSSTVNSVQHAFNVAKKSRANSRKLQKIMAAAKKSTTPKSSDSGNGQMHFSALQLVYDPQAFAEKLFTRVKSSQFAFETKLYLLNLVSRLIAMHKLFLLGYYTYMQKYIQPHQRDVTSLLAYTAQAAHDLVPPDVLAPVIRSIADQFVTDHASREVLAAGLNSIREICARSPLAMDADLLSDLVQYKTHRDKSVVMASRSLIGLFREVYPALLPKSDRGKSASMAVQAGDVSKMEFGLKKPATRVAGAEFLDRIDQERFADDDDAAWQGWEDDSSSDGESSGEGEWINVQSDDEEDIEILLDSDSEPELVKDSCNAVDHDGLKSVGSSDAPTPSISSNVEVPLPLEATRFLTPADFSRMTELRQQAAKVIPEGKSKRLKRAAAQSIASDTASIPSPFNAVVTHTPSDVPDFVDETSLVPVRKKPKSDYEERMASIAAGRDGRDKFGSRKGNKEAGKSTSNSEKRRHKDFNMVSKSRLVSGKKKSSLKDKTRAIREDINRRKKAL